MVRLAVGARYEIVIRSLDNSEKLITGLVKALAHETKNGLVVLQCESLEFLGQEREETPDNESDIDSTSCNLEVNNMDEEPCNDSDDDHSSYLREKSTYPFKCLDCDKSYKSKYTLRRHERETHSKDSWRECDICHREFKREYLFLKHTCLLDN